MSVEEYLALPEEKPYLEYVDGEAVPKTMPDDRHMLLAAEFDIEIGLYRRATGGLSGPEHSAQRDALFDQFEQTIVEELGQPH